MPFKGRRAAVAVQTPPAAPAADVIHNLKVATNKNGPWVVVACGKEGAPYKGKGKGGLRTTIWHREVTCPECQRQPGTPMSMMPVIGDDDGSE